MKKMILILVLVAVACAPAMAAVTISGSKVGSTFTLNYAVSGPNSIRAFAMDIAATSGTITAVNCTSSAPLGYYIYPGSIQIQSGSIAGYGDCVCTTNYPDTKGGEGTSAVTVEMGSLYTGTTKPASSGQLLTLTLSNSAAAVVVSRNVARGGIVMENPAEAAGDNLPLTIPMQVAVPNVTSPAKFESTVMNADSAYAAITNAGLVYARATPTTSATVAAGKIITQVPAACTMVEQGSTVTCTPSTGPATCSSLCGNGDVITTNDLQVNDMSGIKAKIVAAYNRTGLYKAIKGSDVTGDQWHICADAVPNNNIELNDMSSVKAKIVDGQLNGTGRLYKWPYVPNVVGLTRAAAVTALTAKKLTAGTDINACSNTVPVGSVISTNPVAGTYKTCGSSVVLTVSTGPCP